MATAAILNSRHLEFLNSTITLEPLDRFSSNLKRKLLKLIRIPGNNIRTKSKMSTAAILSSRHLEFLNSAITFEPLERFS